MKCLACRGDCTIPNPDFYSNLDHIEPTVVCDRCNGTGEDPSTGQIPEPSTQEPMKEHPSFLSRSWWAELFFGQNPSEK